MNWTNKKSPGTTVQLKTGAPAPGIKRPVAPPVYRPQPVPKVLQRKTLPGQSPHPVQPPRQPIAPPVYRPHAKPAIVQPKIVQAKLAAPARIKTPSPPPPVYRPQPKPNAPRPNAVVQRYTTPDIKELGGKGKLSENENYFVPASFAGDLIYAATTATAPRRSNKYQGEKAARTRRYQGYTSMKFLKDCLHTAEEINKNDELKTGGVQSKVSGTTEAFGASDAANITAASSYASDDAAAPAVGQAYVIVNKKWPKGPKYPYHAAAVVATDGNDRVTLEVFAGTSDASARNTYGKYSMYATGGGSGDKFHSYWKDNFFGADSATVVIESK